MILIPAIDLRAGYCVRLLHGDFAAETRYSVDPGALLARYRALGANWLHIVDLDGARDGSPDNRAVILDLALRQSMNLQVGGGLRNSAALQQILDSGVARAVIGSAAITHVAQVRAWLERFGAERLTLAFDVCIDDDGVPRVMTHGWQQQSAQSLWEALEAFAASPLKHVLCTDVGRDGALSGPNVALYREAVRRYPRIAWQASGGIRNAHDLHLLAETGAAAAISGKALLEELIPAEELQPFLRSA
ncbi:MAG TPA: 1-(5-phosphoribosyl)-5-[(5-phosphoribosylamino)methylideneamino] imidazole-4-carboxamide isomerase [Steroidobacteraceae bacterium]|jgi:phosphoribosylformimino-5-aminoimidazole carboxamide ribotide isomerase|nr:1-(5-phosphoribosyl)-5-[(5-phosphoribosylamino)methylideneamino] imidazole-4-carboxamide isomerase [Steroidobacteraceae bacterium]